MSVYVTNLRDYKIGVDQSIILQANATDIEFQETGDLMVRLAKLEAAGHITVQGEFDRNYKAGENLAANDMVCLKTASYASTNRAVASNVATVTIGSVNPFLAGQTVTVTAAPVTKATTRAACTDQVVTLTFGAAHGWVVGDVVTVTSLTASTLNKASATITAVASTTISYAVAAGVVNVVDGADTTGSVVGKQGAGYEVTNVALSAVGATTVSYPCTHANESILANTTLTVAAVAFPVRAWKASSDVTTKPAVGFAKATVTKGSLADVHFKGDYTTTGLTPGAPYYLGTAGAITATAPSAGGSVRQAVGYALDNLVMRIEIDDPKAN